MDVSKFAPYAKAVAAVVGWLATVIALYLSLTSDGELGPDDVGALVTAVLGGVGTSFGVYQVKNKKGA